MDEDIDVSLVIQRLGGTSVVAAIFGIEPPSVSEWKKNKAIPRARLMYLKLARPDVFSDQCATTPATHDHAPEAAA